MNTNKTAYEKPSGNERRIASGQSLHIIEIAKRIQDKILLLEKEREKIDDAGMEKASSASKYKKEVGIRLIKLNNGVVMGIDGNMTEKPPATLSPKIAEALCFQEQFDMDVAEHKYKAIIVKMQSIQAEVNALQSLNRHLEHEVE